MKSISVYRVEPNRIGKNRNRYGSPSPAKLGTEPYSQGLRTAAGQERPRELEEMGI